ncbi:MAG: hypothetical protein NZL95_00855 [Chitinophagales bacterium]|nr:hypothetical protein [Chitinophagales bacterium]MDW8427084.1 hypothetical protein [Chitinophagales bacterium]
MQQLVCVGRVNRAFGLKGHLRFFIEPAYLHRLKRPLIFFIAYRQTVLPFAVQEFSLQASGHGLMLLEGISNRAEAQQFVGRKLMVEASKLRKPPKPKGPASWVGFSVQDQKLGALGVLDDVLLFPHHPVGVLHVQGKEVLIPLHDDFIVQVSASTKKLKLRLPEGLLDCYLT